MAGHKSMLGKPIDMEKLYRQHETVRAVGNANMNARGDQIGQGGKIVRRREETVAEYYDTNPLGNRKQKTIARAEPPEIVEATPAPTATASIPTKSKTKASE